MPTSQNPSVTALTHRWSTSYHPQLAVDGDCHPTSVPTQTTAYSSTVAELIKRRQLTPHFQPIVSLAAGSLFGHEALIRTPAGCPFTSPDQLFEAARAEGLQIELELECVHRSLNAWTQHVDNAGGGLGKLFLNLSAGALVAALASDELEIAVDTWRAKATTAHGLVVELTEHEHVRDFDALMLAVGKLRRYNISLALDDFGDGRSSLRLWSQIKPEIVKIDKYFSQDLDKHPDKLQTLRALQQISQTLGSSLVAEGIETLEVLHLVRDLGIRLGQGWALGQPQAVPALAAPAEARQVMLSRDIAVFPERRRKSQQRASVWTLLREIEPVSPTTTNEELFLRFASDDALRAVAIVEDARPVGLLTRERFVDRYAKPFFRELYGRQPCTAFANLTPHLIDVHHGIDELTEVLTSEDQRYLADGVVITENGRYRGLGTGEDLVRLVTEARIEAARHANPLTLLPGNIPITQHMRRLLDAGREFVACYADLNHFKPFNDLYGYWRGDEMLLLAAKTISAIADARRDFVGHVGGDDFLIMFQSEDWMARCQQIVERFDAAARGLYDQQAQKDGWVRAEDRHGVERFHPLTTLTIGAVHVTSNPGISAEDVANAAAAAKRKAKASNAGVMLLDAC